jgi:hypothetical protein
MCVILMVHWFIQNMIQRNMLLCLAMWGEMFMNKVSFVVVDFLFGGASRIRQHKIPTLCSTVWENLERDQAIQFRLRALRVQRQLVETQTLQLTLNPPFL